MTQIVREIFERTGARVAQHLVTYVPPLIVAATILVSAFVLATFVRWVILKLVRGSGLDRFLRESGLSSMLDRSGRLRGARIVAGACYWTILVIGFLTALDVFDTTLTSRIIEATVFSIPKLISAAAILLAGFWLAQYLSRTALIWAVNEAMPLAGRLATLIKLFVIFVAVVVAADALNFARQVFFSAFVILVGAAALAAAIAAGLSLRESLEKYLRRGPEPPSKHEERSLWTHL